MRCVDMGATPSDQGRLVGHLSRRREQLVRVVVEELGEGHQIVVLAAAVDGADDVNGSSRRTLVAFEQAGGAVAERLVQGVEIDSVWLRYHGWIPFQEWGDEHPPE